MKLTLALSLIMTVAALVTSPAQARSIMKPATAVAQYSFGMMNNQEEESEDKIFVLRKYTATLYSNKTLQVSETTYKSESRWTANGQNGVEVIATKKLSKDVYAMLFTDVTTLSGAEIVNSHRGIVCMMMPIWGMSQDHLQVARGFDHQTQIFAGSLELVDGPHGCWLANQTHPKEEWIRSTAQTLKRSIKLLAL